MVKQTIKYTDYDGTEREEDFYFNMNKLEATKFGFSQDGGIEEYVKRIMSNKDNKKILELFEDFILSCYGEKSADGKRFIKSKELTEEFRQTEAFVELYFKMASDADFAADFIKRVLPKVDENTKPQLVQK